jgi:hypothetical protein
VALTVIAVEPRLVFFACPWKGGGVDAYGAEAREPERQCHAQPSSPSDYQFTRLLAVMPPNDRLGHDEPGAEVPVANWRHPNW